MSRGRGAWRSALSVLAAVIILTASGSRPDAQTLPDLDRIFADPVLSRALLAVRVESLRDGRVLYARDDEKLVMPGSNMKILTLSVAVDRLGWNFTYETRLDAAGTIAGGVLHGDLVVVGSGDPSIGALADRPSPVFDEWADALRAAGIGRVEGRLIGDDDAFEDEGLGAGWAWDYLGAGYAAPSGALNYNENAATVTLMPGKSAGEPVRLDIAPAGHLLEVVNDVHTGAAGTDVDVDVFRRPGSARAIVRGSVPANGAMVTKSAAVENPTKFFVEALRLALARRGITITGGALDIDDITDAPAASARRTIARHVSAPLAELAARFMKTSPNVYGETLLKTIGRAGAGTGTAEAGKRIVRDTLVSWGIPADAFVMYDGSGLSRYNYVTTRAITLLLRRMWSDPRSRGPFSASLAVGGHDGTLDERMKNTALDARVQAKTGTISNVRALSGYLETQSGERIAFSMIANHFTAPNAEIDRVMERALTALAADR